MQRAVEPLLHVGGVEVALCCPSVVRLRMHIWFSRTGLSMAAEVASRASVVSVPGRSGLHFSLGVAGMGGRRLVEKKGLSAHFSTILGKCRVSEEIGDPRVEVHGSVSNHIRDFLLEHPNLEAQDWAATRCSLLTDCRWPACRRGLNQKPTRPSQSLFIDEYLRNPAKMDWCLHSESAGRWMRQAHRDHPSFHS
jgi:hypothetical protein